MRLDIREESFGNEDQSWLATDHGTDTAEPMTLDVSAFTEATHFPDGFIPSGMTLGKIAASGLYGPYGGNASEVQTIDLGAATAGTITIEFDGEVTDAINFNATAATVQAELEELSNINPGDVVVTGGPLPGTITLTFGGQYLGQNVPEVIVTPTGLTGGTVTVATTTQGGSAVSDGREDFAGHLLTSQKVDPLTVTADVQGALYTHGDVVESKLPANHGLDAAAKESVKGRIRYR